jgi:hypothetical protein
VVKPKTSSSLRWTCHCWRRRQLDGPTLIWGPTLSGVLVLGLGMPPPCSLTCVCTSNHSAGNLSLRSSNQTAFVLVKGIRRYAIWVFVAPPIVSVKYWIIYAIPPQKCLVVVLLCHLHWQNPDFGWWGVCVWGTFYSIAWQRLSSPQIISCTSWCSLLWKRNDHGSPVSGQACARVYPSPQAPDRRPANIIMIGCLP